jgi:ribose 5-phosphate isomerase B
MKPTVYFATDHAGFLLKQALVLYVRDDLGYTVVDVGAHYLDEADDYPDFVALAALKVSERPTDRAIVLGASGQGEAMVANRFPQVRAAVFYGLPEGVQTDALGNSLDLLASSRLHNDANVLSLGARFITEAVAKEAVAAWLTTNFSADERHVRRIKKIEQLGR